MKLPKLLENTEKNITEVLKERKFGIAIARFLCPIVLETGQKYKREKIIQLIYDYYTKLSGKDVERKKVTLTVKAFVNDRNYFKRLEHYHGDRGYYRYIGPSDPNLVSKPHLEKTGDNTSINNLKPEHDYSNEKMGEAEVYAWCLPLYQKTPDKNGCYPIKISWAGSGGFAESYYSFKENLPEKPVYLLQFFCSNEKEAKRLKEFFHSVLMKRKINGIDGTEWFQTKPEEIINAYESFWRD